jgi:type I restriction enzyme S subunit
LKTQNLKTLCTKIGSGSTPRGGDSVYTTEGTSLIRSQNVLDFTFSESGLAFINDKQAKELANVELKENDILINITGDSVARVCKVPTQYLPARVNQHVAILRANQEVLLPDYLKYSLLSKTNKEKLLSLASTGATRKALTKSMLEEFEILLPDLPTQTRIAEILSSLDDKIELNCQMNQTLEQMAQTLFKKYFVDDIDEENLPEGWSTLGLDKIANFLNGLPLQKFKPKDEKQALPIIKIRELKNGISPNTEKADKNIASQYIVEDGDILFSWSGTLEVDIWCNGKGALNQHIYKVTSATFPKWFYYYWIKEHLQEFKNIAASKATTMGHIQRGHLTEAEVYIPTKGYILKVDGIISPLIKKIIDCKVEIKTLTQLRDTLLPKLMSGEIDVNAVQTEKAYAEVLS